MLVKAGSKLYLFGEYAVLKPDSYAIISYIEKFTYLDIELSNESTIKSTVEDKGGYILKILAYMNEYLGKEYAFDLNYTTELYIDNKKYGLGSSASLTVVTIKGILEVLGIKYTKRELFDLVVDFMIKNNISGSFGDVACIVYQAPIIFKSSDRINRNYEIEIIEDKINLEIKAIWTKEEFSTDKAIKKVDVDSEYFDKFRNKSNDIVKSIICEIRENRVEDILLNINNLTENLRYLEQMSGVNIHTDEINRIIRENRYAKISGAGGGDFVLICEKKDIFKMIKVEKFL